jgi:regulator of protease activity HflC (stomatin/prohibitin superfamily)
MDDQKDNLEHASRRKQSAKFTLQNKEDNVLDITEAMDTAHQSLTSSLQLSFRALQLAMLVLVCLYLVSGFRTVEDSQTGVATLFGKIIDKQGLQPGLQTNWPPPIGGFEVYAAQHREGNIGYVFKPRIDARLSPEQRISKAKSSDGLRPGVDGSLLTSDGDLAHMEISSSWEIIDPVEYANAVSDTEGKLFVTSALEKAAVHVVGKMTIEELLDKPLEELRALIMQDAQQTLNVLNCGIRISDVIIPNEPEPPLYIQKSYAAFDSARIQAETSIERAVASAHETLIEAAGSNYETLLMHIDAYEKAAELGDEEDKRKRLADINLMLQEGEVSGKAAMKISIAEGYRAQIETTLGQDYRRFQSLLPTYLEHPELVIQNKWLEMYSSVLSNEDVETMFVPSYISMVKLGVTGSDEIAQLRHQNLLRNKENRTHIEETDLLNPWILRARDIEVGKVSRELSIIDGVVQGKN